VLGSQKKESDAFGQITDSLCKKKPNQTGANIVFWARRRIPDLEKAGLAFSVEKGAVEFGKKERMAP